MRRSSAAREDGALFMNTPLRRAVLMSCSSLRGAGSSNLFAILEAHEIIENAFETVLSVPRKLPSLCGRLVHALAVYCPWRF